MFVFFSVVLWFFFLLPTAPGHDEPHMSPGGQGLQLLELRADQQEPWAPFAVVSFFTSGL